MVTYDKQFRFIKDEFGEPILIGGVSAVGVMRDVGELSSSYFSDKILNTMYPVRSGDVVSYQDKNWIAIKQADQNKHYNSTRIREAIWNTNFLIQGVLFAYPSFYTINNIGIDSGTVIDLAAGKLVCCIPANETTNMIAINDRFIKFSNAWIVSGVDATNNGLLYLHADKTSIAAGDDLINEIPAGTLDTYSLQWAKITTQIYEGETFQTGVIVYRNGEVDNTVKMTYKSSNPAIAMISNTGLITAVSEGDFTVSVGIVGIPSATLEQAVTVEDVIYTIAFTDIPSFMKIGDTYMVQAVVYRNGEAAQTPVIYSVDDDSVAIIDASSGLLTALQTGFVNITASADSGAVSVTDAVVVSDVNITLSWAILPAELYVDNKSIFNVAVTENGVTVSNRRVVYELNNVAAGTVTNRNNTQSWVTPTIAGAVTVTAYLADYPFIKLTKTLNATTATVNYEYRWNFNGTYDGTVINVPQYGGLPEYVYMGTNTRVRLVAWKKINGVNVANSQDNDDFEITFNSGGCALISGQTGIYTQPNTIDIYPKNYTNMVTNKVTTTTTFKLINSNRSYQQDISVKFNP